MWHLIQPIVISGTPYCVKHGNTTPKWRTDSILSGGADTGGGGEDADIFLIDGGGYVRFATCCVWKITLRFVATGVVAGPGVLYAVEINGTTYETDTPGVIGTYEVTVDLNALGLMGRPCGNIWDITSIFTGYVEIIDVTFGPPV
jgi:hypothetical protein